MCIGAQNWRVFFPVFLVYKWEKCRVTTMNTRNENTTTKQQEIIMNYFHIPQPMIKEMRALLVELEKCTAIENVSNRAVILRTALSGVNAFIAKDVQDCHHAS